MFIQKNSILLDNRGQSLENSGVSAGSAAIAITGMADWLLLTVCLQRRDFVFGRNGLTPELIECQ